MRALCVLFISLLICCACSNGSRYNKEVDVLIVGGGASGTMAGIQASRLGVETLIAEETPWLGGMLTSAGVSAIDGNYRLHSGLWNEFRSNLYEYYGGKDAVKTGWVSNVLFEPSVGNEILKKMTGNEKKLKVQFCKKLKNIQKIENGWEVLFYDLNTEEKLKVKTKIIIDGTELGDVAKMAGIPYDIGMDSKFDTNEEIAPVKENNIIQDLTYVVILKDYGNGVDKTIQLPENYSSEPFLCTCKGKCKEDKYGRTLWPCDHMMEYGRLPNDKFMINWPISGNDYYLNVIEMTDKEREAAYEKAKWFTKCYIYYLQTELGFKNFGIAENEFPTDDGFPFFPYHRESRRIKGKVRFTVNDLAKPFEQQKALYRTGIAVGDYPIDHHHAAYHNQKEVPDLHFFPVPSFTLPLGTLIPNETEDFIVAEKSISVTNIVNGTTRLQPVCMLLGQASGVLAALAVKNNVTPADVNVREVQKILLQNKAYIQPYADVLPNNKCWEAVQKIGATGIIKGEGKNKGWANYTFFYPDSAMTAMALKNGIRDMVPNFDYDFPNEIVSIDDAINVSKKLCGVLNKKRRLKENNEEIINEVWNKYGLEKENIQSNVSRSQMAAILNEIADPFDVYVDLYGNY